MQRYKLTYHTYLARGGWLSYTPSVASEFVVVGYAKLGLFVLKFLPFANYVMLTWEKIPSSPHFSVLLQAMKSWAGPGNKASKECKLLEKSSWTAEMCSQLWWYNTANSVMICNCSWQTSKQCKFNSNLQLLAGATCINIMTAAQWMILYRVDLSPYCATAYNSSPVQVFLDLTLTIIGKW